MEKIELFDNTGKLLHSEDAKRYQRISQTGAANQRRLDMLCKEFPSATTAQIGTAKFAVSNGRSVWVD